MGTDRNLCDYITYEGSDRINKLSNHSFKNCGLYWEFKTLWMIGF